MHDVMRVVERVAPTDSSVLVLGESGTGKELVARAIHERSQRAQRPFVPIHCGALPREVLESELFGHEKGSFTGAHAEKKGLFEVADRGSLFLDEIAELNIGLQAKLLRALQERKVRRVGGTHEISVDVRVVAATNRDLRAMVADGRFRDDLYYRINVLSIDVPPLRERREDIPVLIDYFVKKHTRNTSRLIKGLTPEARKVMLDYAWPGNVRQLENEVRRALLLSDDQIDVGNLSIPDAGSADAPDVGLNVRARIDRLEVQLVEEALERTSGNQTQAAKLLGVSRYGLHKMMRRLGLSRSD
jgi:transcriptional regulator with PAS, ATPase and Fis domain